MTHYLDETKSIPIDAMRSEPKPLWQPGMTLEQAERRTILAALDYHDGNKSHTAKHLEMSLSSLKNKLRKYAHQDRIFRQDLLTE